MKYIAVFFLAVGLLPAYAQPPASLRIETVENTQTILTPPIPNDFQFAVEEYDVTFRPEAIQKITRASGNTWKLDLSTGESFKSPTNKSGQISGKSDWGTARIPWSKIKSIEFIAGTAEEGNGGEQQPEAQKSPTVEQWKITSTSGKTLRLNSLNQQRLDLSMSTQGVTLALSLDKLRLLERIPDAKKDTFKATCLDGKEFIGTFENDGSLTTVTHSGFSGKNPLGEVHLALAKLTSLRRLADPPAAEKAEPDAKPWGALVTKSGFVTEARLENQTDLPVKQNDLEITLIVPNVESIEIDPQVPGQGKVNGIPVKFITKLGLGETLKAATPYGTVSFARNQLRQYTAAPGSVSCVTVPANALTLQTKGGTSVMAWNLGIVQHPGASKTAQVTEIHWAMLQSATANADGSLGLTGLNQTTYSLKNCELAATTLLGSLYVPAARIASIQPAAPPVNTSAAPLTAPMARLQLADGSVLDAVKLSINDSICSYNSWLDGYCELTKSGLLYWIKKDLLLQRGFSAKKGGIVFNLTGTPEFFDKANLSLLASNTLVTLNLPAGTVTELTPTGAPLGQGSPPPAASPTVSPTPSGTARHVGEIVFRNGGKLPLEYQEIQFANYPSRAWTGSYYHSQWPFQWWRSNDIDIKKDGENTEISVELEKLEAISVRQPYDGSLSFRSKSGSKMAGRHVRDHLNTKLRSGPSEWDIEKEGILLTTGPEFFVFVPFMAIENITFK